MKKLIIVTILGVLTTGCSPFNDHRPQVLEGCMKADSGCIAVEGLCERGTIGASDCQNLSEACRLLRSGCIIAAQESDSE